MGDVCSFMGLVLVHFQKHWLLSTYCICNLKTVQDFLIKLGIKLHMHLWEISIFSLNNDLVRLTKIMNNFVKDLKILSFKVIFQCLKLVKSFQKKICEEYLIRTPTYINEIFWKLWFLKYRISANSFRPWIVSSLE